MLAESYAEKTWACSWKCIDEIECRKLVTKHKYDALVTLNKRWSDNKQEGSKLKATTFLLVVLLFMWTSIDALPFLSLLKGRDLHKVVRGVGIFMRLSGIGDIVVVSKLYFCQTTSQGLSIDQCWTGKDWSFGVRSGLWPFGHRSRLVLVLVNPKLGPKTGPDRTLKH